MSQNISYSGSRFSPMFEDGMFRYRISAPVIRPRTDLSFTSKFLFSPNLDRFRHFRRLPSILRDCNGYAA